MFATAAYGKATQRYAAIDLSSNIEAASPHRLIAILYEEAMKILDTLAVGLAANGTLSRQGAIQRRGRANSILMGLEACLDHSEGGELAAGLQSVYRETRRLVGMGVDAHDPKPVIQAREMIAEIAEAWAKIG